MGVHFRNGINSLEVVTRVDGMLYKDYMEVDFELLPYDFAQEGSFKDLSINLGTL